MKDTKQKVITIAALVIAVIALSIGFAAFTSTLNISTSAHVTPEDGNFIVKFSKLNGELDETNVTPSTGTGDNARINNTNASNPVISNLSAQFTQPGETVEYTFYVRNMGKYDAHLTDVRFNKTAGEFKTCTATGDNPVSDTIKNSICSAIKFTVTLENSPSNISLTSTSDYANDVNVDYIVNKSSTPNTGTTNSKMVKVRIEYPSNAPHADGSFEVEFGSVEMIFASLAGYVPPVPAATNDNATSDSIVDDLAPDPSLNINGQYVIAVNGEELGVTCSKVDGSENIDIWFNNKYFLWFVDEASANGYNTMAGTNFEANKWYVTEDYEIYEEYTLLFGSPISLSDFEGGTVYDSEYLQRIIASFGS